MTLTQNCNVVYEFGKCERKTGKGRDTIKPLGIAEI
jgi:hypothetical protein